MSTERLPIAVKRSPRSFDAFVTYVLHLIACLIDNPSFSSPSPSVATLKNKADGLADANAKARTGGKAAVADRKAKRLDLEDDIDQLVAYVRGTVKAQAADPAAAAAMIVSSGLSIRKPRKAQKAPFAAKHGRVSGEIVLVARAVGKQALYFWEYSVDEKTWIAVPATMQARTTIAGLTPGQVYAFRFRAHTRRGLGDYSDAVKLMAM